jgi:hypothetical protein
MGGGRKEEPQLIAYIPFQNNPTYVSWYGVRT